MAAGQDEPVAPDPVRVGRVVAQVPLEEQVRRRREAHRRAGVAVADLLDGVHGQDPDGVDRAAVEVGPVEGPRQASSSDVHTACREPSDDDGRRPAGSGWLPDTRPQVAP